MDVPRSLTFRFFTLPVLQRSVRPFDENASLFCMQYAMPTKALSRVFFVGANCFCCFKITFSRHFHLAECFHTWQCPPPWGFLLCTPPALRPPPFPHSLAKQDKRRKSFFAGTMKLLTCVCSPLVSHFLLNFTIHLTRKNSATSFRTHKNITHFLIFLFKKKKTGASVFFCFCCSVFVFFQSGKRRAADFVVTVLKLGPRVCSSPAEGGPLRWRNRCEIEGGCPRQALVGPWPGLSGPHLSF